MCFHNFVWREKKPYCLFVKIRGHCPKLVFINEFLFLINCNQIHISSFCSLAFHHVPVLSLEMFFPSLTVAWVHCSSSSHLLCQSFPHGAAGWARSLLCPTPTFRCRRWAGCAFPGTDSNALFQMKFTSPFCSPHHFRQADVGNLTSDTRFVAQETVTQTKLNICLISFYKGQILMEIRLFKGHWGYTTFLKKPFFFCAVRYSCCLYQGELAPKEFKCLVEKYCHLLALSMYATNTKKKKLRQLFSSIFLNKVFI